MKGESRAARVALRRPVWPCVARLAVWQDGKPLRDPCAVPVACGKLWQAVPPYGPRGGVFS